MHSTFTTSFPKFAYICQVQVKCVGLHKPAESYVITAYTDPSCLYEAFPQHLGTSSRKPASSLGNRADAKNIQSMCGKMPANEPYHQVLKYSQTAVISYAG